MKLPKTLPIPIKASSPIPSTAVSEINLKAIPLPAVRSETLIDIRDHLKEISVPAVEAFGQERPSSTVAFGHCELRRFSPEYQHWNAYLIFKLDRHV
ncbi:MAG: hypothetical protein ACRERU_14885 [Methylococcales bacterium]